MRLPLSPARVQDGALVSARVCGCSLLSAGRWARALGALAPLLCSAALFGLGCEAASSEPARPLRVSVFDEDDQALAGIPVELDGISAIRTGHDGTARISLSRTGPARARIAVRCAPGSREAAPRYISRAAAGTVARLELTFSCRPLQRKLLILVRAPGAEGALVRADGVALGPVEPDGTLHATLWRAPDSDLRLVIDTRAQQITPQNPVREVRVADRDELVVFDQAFVARAVPDQGHGRRARRHAWSDVPQASGVQVR